MVFITGPRQVGKTWLAKDIARAFPNSVYLNYDSAGDRKIIREEAWLPETDLLRSRTGSPISYQSIAEDVGVAPNTVKKYIQILESLFIVFKVTPYARNIARSVVKAQKIYFYDTGMVNSDDEGVVFENMAALCLLKHVCARVDLEGRPASLHYVRTKDGAEVDFCLVQDNTPELLIEVKRSDARPPPALVNFSKRYGIPATQLVLHLKHERVDKTVRICQGMKFLAAL